MIQGYISVNNISLFEWTMIPEALIYIDLRDFTGVAMKCMMYIFDRKLDVISEHSDERTLSLT